MTTQVLQQKTVDPDQTLSAMLAKAGPELSRIAPKFVNVQRLMSLAIEAKTRSQQLANCSPLSVLNFCKKCAEWGTDRIGAGGVWPVPFWNSKANCYDMTPIPDWRFLVEKAKKSKAIRHAYPDVVCERDQYEASHGTAGAHLVHSHSKGDRGQPILAYCLFTLPDGEKDFIEMAWSEVVSIRDRSKAWKSWIEKKIPCPWTTDEFEMAKKTITKRAMKLFEGASPELTVLIEADNVVNGFTDLGTVERLPIAEPKALSAPTPASEPMPEEPATEAAQESPAAAAVPNPSKATESPAVDSPPAAAGIVCTVTGVEEKSGTSKKTGKPYNLVRVTVQDDAGQVMQLDAWGDTLRETCLAIAKDSRVRVAYEPGKTSGYLNLTSIEAVKEELL